MTDYFHPTEFERCNPPCKKSDMHPDTIARLNRMREIAGIPLRIAVASGLANSRKLVEAIRTGKVNYDFVEIMACPGGCAGGGGQPIVEGAEMAGERGEVLWRLDRESAVRYSHENPDVQALYAQFLEKPLGHMSHHLLHTDHHAWEMPGLE